MSDWAAPDYEPTADEVQEFLAELRADRTPGSHGSIRFVPSMERLIWEVEGVYWGDRHVHEDGSVEFSYVVRPWVRH